MFSQMKQQGVVSWKYAMCPQIFTNSAVHNGRSYLAHVKMQCLQWGFVMRAW